MLNVGYISDLHVWNWLAKLNLTLEEYIKLTGLNNENENEVLIIPGDITENENLLESFLKIIHKNYDYVLFTLGNHDLYVMDNQTTMNKINKIKNIVKKFPNVFLLDGNIVEIKNKKIAGSINWYNVNKDNLNLWKNYMLDSDYIKLKDSIINFKEKERKKLENFSGKEFDIVVSHIMMDTQPILEEGCPLHFLNSEGNDFFYSEENLFKKYNIKTKYHIFGHTHDKYNFRRNEITYLCNPLGYPSENKYSLKNLINSIHLY